MSEYVDPYVRWMGIPETVMRRMDKAGCSDDAVLLEAATHAKAGRVPVGLWCGCREQGLGDGVVIIPVDELPSVDTLVTMFAKEPVEVEAVSTDGPPGDMPVPDYCAVLLGRPELTELWHLDERESEGESKGKRLRPGPKTPWEKWVPDFLLLVGMGLVPECTLDSGPMAIAERFAKYLDSEHIEHPVVEPGLRKHISKELKRLQEISDKLGRRRIWRSR